MNNKNLLRLIFTMLLGAVLTSSTFSPQYLAWIAPFVAFLTPLESGLFIFSSFLTWFYFRYWNDIIALQPIATNLLIFRNAILILLLLITTEKILISIYRSIKNKTLDIE